jgi:ArsR family transcriptional regulator
MSPPLIPDEYVDRVAGRFQILSEPVRLELLNHLNARGEMTVSELVDATGFRQANVSKHLGRMADDGILTRRKEGVHVYYDLDDPTLSALCLLVCGHLSDS